MLTFRLIPRMTVIFCNLSIFQWQYLFVGVVINLKYLNQDNLTINLPVKIRIRNRNFLIKKIIFVENSNKNASNDAYLSM